MKKTTRKPVQTEVTMAAYRQRMGKILDHPTWTVPTKLIKALEYARAVFVVDLEPPSRTHRRRKRVA